MRSRRIALRVAVLISSVRLFAGVGAAAEGTATFRPAAEILIAEASPVVGRHAVTRLVDWNGDERLDLLVADKRGRVWILMERGDSAPLWESPTAVRVDDSDVALAAGNTTACFVDLSGDGLSDLIVVHDDRRASWARNVGRAGAPRFESWQDFAGSEGALELPKGCGARIDVGDWDGDGLADLAAGHFSGPILLYRNTGTPTEPRFGAEPLPLHVNGQLRSFSYNVHPTFFDLNQDGRPDIVYGINWGTIGCFLGSDDAKQRAAFNFHKELTLAAIDGKLALRETAGDDSTPTFGDVDGDGTLDLVSGGEKGKLWLSTGVPIGQSLDELQGLIDGASDKFGEKLAADAMFRNDVVGRLHRLYAHCEGFATTPAAREPIRKWLTSLLERHPRLMRHTQHDAACDPYVPWIAYQCWAILMLCHDGDPDAPEHRRRVADAIGFDGRLREILVNYGTLVIENGRATQNQLQTIDSYLSQIPPILLHDRSVGKVTEVITIGEYLGPRVEVRNAGGVNIFATDSGKPGASENSFPDDFPGVQNDYFGLVLAHELNHRVDATRFAAEPKYDEKYWRHLRKACGADVAFREPVTAGVDWDATKKKFLAAGLWNGEAGGWDAAWENYWLTGPGAARVLNVCRNRTTYRPPRYGIPFFLETRQESIASLANQYFTDSEHMFRFALDRFRRGASGPLDEWLLMADVYSLDGPTTRLYKHANGEVELRHAVAPVTRDDDGNLNGVTVGGERYEFQLDAEGLVERVFNTTRERREVTQE